MDHNKIFKRSAVFAALATAWSAPAVFAADEPAVDDGIEKIEVTATRRAASVQDIPVNITALDGDILSEKTSVSWPILLVGYPA